MSATIRMPLPARPSVSQAPTKTFTRSRGLARTAHRTMIYGPGGIGKTSLAAAFPGVVIVDIEKGSVDHENVNRVLDVTSFGELRSFLQSDDFSDDSAICIDSITKAEEWAVADVLATAKTRDGNQAKCIEDYGYKDGYTMVYDRMLMLLGDLDRLYAKGKHIILIAHSIDAAEKNALGEDFRRRRPRLLNADKTNVVAKYCEWVDHVLCIELDMDVTKKGKAIGGGSRTIYCQDTPARLAKTRTLNPDPIIYEPGDGSLWTAMLGQ